jgi:hypothetical protein
VTRPRRLPAAPLVAAIDRHPAIGKPHRGWKTRLRRYAGTSGLAAYRRAAQEGSVTLRSLEMLCDRFGWHPRELYGDAYDQAAFAGRSPRFDPWKGIA